MEETKPKKILMVDDEEDLQLIIRQNFRRKIRSGEFEFVFALNGVEALNILRKDSSFDAVFTDINMPEMDGLTLIKNITGNYPDLKAVVVSAYGDMTNVRSAMNYGAFDFVTKPLDFSDLEITLDKTVAEVTRLKSATENILSLNFLKNEMEVGRKIQTGFLPDKLPKINGWEFNAFSLPARDVGGDFYDLFEIPDTNIIVMVIADVCGKGVGAALFMALLRGLLRAFTVNSNGTDKELEEIITGIHKYIIANHEATGMFATMFAGFLNHKTGELSYVNAGHIPPVIISGGEVKEKLMPDGPALGVFEDFEYKVSKCMINKGGLLAAFTDGITDCLNPEGEMFGDERLNSLLTLNADKTRELTDTLKDALNEFSKNEEQTDDITFLSAGRTE